jgi:hypothetical protein
MTIKKFKIKMDNRIADHIINAILIFTSVFLAFWMNEVRARKQSVDLTNEARTAILTELKINLLVLERWAPYHKTILEKGEDFVLNNADALSQFDLSLIPGLNNGIQREILTSNGWSLIDDQQINFDLKTRLLVNQIYEQQKYVTKATSRITEDFLMDREVFDNTKVKENYLMFYSLIAELWGQEDAMIKRLKESINDIE